METRFVMEKLATDTGYSSGENDAFLESKAITSYIPPDGTYKGGPDDFIYVERLRSLSVSTGKDHSV